jgi:hypothetical protein
MKSPIMKSPITRRTFVGIGAATATGLSGVAVCADEAKPAATIQNDHFKMVIGSNGRNLAFIDKRTGKDYCDDSKNSLCFSIVLDGKRTYVTNVTSADGQITARFGDTGVTAVLRPKVNKHHIVLEVVSITPEPDEFIFLDVPLILKTTPDEPFVACSLALDLQTNNPQIPQPMGHLTSTCVGRFGCKGAKVAIIGCPSEGLRRAMQEAVSAAPELPHSPIGGPWAMGKPINQGSYLFNFGDMSEDNVDDWIRVAKMLGFNQIDFHGGNSFRFGDCRPNPKTYPKGMASFKAVIDRLHAAGIKAGLHTYAFFIDKKCPWVTPVPDPRLAKDAAFTLAESLDEKVATVPVVEPTKAMSAITGFAVRNSVTLQIDDELITYKGIAKEPPYAFTDCVRGACGTKVAKHEKGAKVHHLKECFGLFVPNPETTLLAEVAGKTATMFNTCGFDMIYLDALDGEDTLGGRENSWHYGSQFVFEIQKRLKKPALFEMSTFHHHLWYVRSRHGAWDHPTRSHKKFIDNHINAVKNYQRMFLPGHLGWWAMKTFSDSQGEPTFTDDIEYLMCKCLGMNVGLSMMGIDPSTIKKLPVLPRLADIIKRYEDLRHSRKVPEAMKEKLRKPGEEFTLVGSLEKGWEFLPTQYSKNKFTGVDSPSATWTMKNKFESQPIRLRIEALLAAGPYDAPENVILADFESKSDLPNQDAVAGVTARLVPSDAKVKVGSNSGRLTALHTQSDKTNTWAFFEKTFEPTLDLSGHQAMGVWIHGDESGAVLNFRAQSPSHISHADNDHYVVVDFTGWRYFELIEPEGGRHDDYKWPYGGLYATYRESVRYKSIEKFSVWCNNLPSGKTTTCYLSPVKAVPVVETKLIKPSLTVGDKTITFPVEIKSSQYLEYGGPNDCKLYSGDGGLLQEVATEGNVPILAGGENEIHFSCSAPDRINARANVTVITHG